MEKASLTFLGTGTSQGVPIIGCECDVCKSSDPRDKRLRASALVHWRGLTILIDAGPDFRYQMLRAGVKHLDAILLTHSHKDHTGGLDDVRSFNLIEGKPVNIYCQKYVEDSLRREYAYAFSEIKYPGVPEWNVHLIDNQAFRVYSNAASDTLEWVSGKGYLHHPAAVEGSLPFADVIPIQGWHDAACKFSVLGYRFGNVAYLTDLKCIADSEIEKLKGLDVVTVNCVKRTPHHSHFSLYEAIDFCRKVGARDSYITHLSHMLPSHGVLESELPSGIHLAYDGLTVG